MFRTVWKISWISFKPAMNTNYKSMLQQAAKLFQKHDYTNALKLYSLVYKDNPGNVDAKAGILLSSLPEDMQEDVQQLYDFYNIAKTFDAENSYEALESLVESLESGVTRASDGSIISFDEMVETEEGITYSDFKRLLEESDDFKEVFQNVFFSTKVIITQKKDFFEFINTLIEHEYIEMALSYIDNASSVFPADEQIRELLKKIKDH
jgi:hypothetical protein